MADYDKGIPNGTMRIRDVGNNWVEFWFITGSSTWNNDQMWHTFYDGAWHDHKVAIPKGGNWFKVHSAYLTNRQEVRFVIDASGLGWPTSEHVVFIERARVPDPPYPPDVHERNDSQIHVSFQYGYDGGMGIDAAEVWYSYDGNPRFMLGGRDVWIGGLSPKTRYYFWGKVHNPIGWSGFSGRSEAMTLGVPDAPELVTLYDIEQSSLWYTFNPGWDGGTPTREVQLGYGLDPNAPQLFRNLRAGQLTNLSPAGRYYFWARSRNDIGWSPWSPRVEALLLAGSWIKVQGVWKRALPWNKVGGEWKIAKPNIPLNGTWKVPRS